MTKSTPDQAKKMENPQDALSALLARAGEAAQRMEGAGVRDLPPVEKWNPPFCGDIDMEIRADGRWFYMGSAIERPAMVRLFSTVLRKDEDGRSYLVTPVEKIGIKVEDAPFLAVEMQVVERDGQQVLVFRTNLGDVVEAGHDHSLRFQEDETGGLKPYIRVRGRLEALLTRALAYDLAALGEEMEMDGRMFVVIRSGDAIFPLMSVDDLPDGGSET